LDDGIAIFLAFRSSAFIPYFRGMQLHRDETGLGWLLAAFRLGGSTGAVTVAQWARCVIAVRLWLSAEWYSSRPLSPSAIRTSFGCRSVCSLWRDNSAILMISSFNVAIQHLASDQMRAA